MYVFYVLYTYTHTCIYIYIYVHTYTYIYIQMPKWIASTENIHSLLNIFIWFKTRKWMCNTSFTQLQLTLYLIWCFSQIPDSCPLSGLGCVYVCIYVYSTWIYVYYIHICTHIRVYYIHICTHIRNPIRFCNVLGLLW